MSDESGNVTITALLFMGSLAMALVLALEASCAYAQKTVYDNLLNIAREETFSAGFDMQLKSSGDPGLLICSKVRDSLRANGYQGRIEMEFYEATPEEIENANPAIDSADNVRVIVYRIAIGRPYRNTVTPTLWLSDVMLASETTATMCPYALHKTFRPDDIDGAVWSYTVPADSSEIQVENAGAQLGQTLSEELARALKKPSEIHDANQ